MGSRSLSWLLLVLFALATPAWAEPDYKQLKEEIKRLEKSVEDAARERNDADKKLADNRAAQQKAGGNELAALKKEAKTLSDDARSKADTLATAQQNLASKQGELRETAAKHAVDQLSATGDIEVRVGEATNALDDWKSALGTLPNVPALSSLDGISERAVQDAIRAGDKKTLEAYEKWAAAEEARIDKEIKQAKEIADAEAALKASKDGGAELRADAKSLKETLETRKKDVAKLRQTAKDTIKQIK